MLCHVTAFVVRLTPRTVLLQTSVAALFPLTGTIFRGRDATPGLRATDRWMQERDRRNSQTQTGDLMSSPGQMSVWVPDG